MGGGDDADVWSNHYIVGDIESAEIIKSAILIDEDIASDGDVCAAGCVERGDQQEGVVYFLADEFAQKGADFVGVIEGQTVEAGSNRHGSFDAGEHSGGFRCAPRNCFGAGVIGHSLFSRDGYARKMI